MGFDLRGVAKEVRLARRRGRAFAWGARGGRGRACAARRSARSKASYEGEGEGVRALAFGHIHIKRGEYVEWVSSVEKRLTLAFGHIHIMRGEYARPHMP